MIRYSSTSLADTKHLAVALARWIPHRMVVLLIGTLGAGKTHLVRDILAEWRINPEDVVSPTFTICNEFVGDRDVKHLDLYRLHDEDELFELGLDELVESEHVVFIEWADKFLDLLPKDHLEIKISIDGDCRQFQISANECAAHNMDELIRVL